MTILLIEFVIVLIGLAMTPILFYHFPALPKVRNESVRFPTVSVIIPARNEEKTLPLLLEDLKNQSLVPYEVICVDDASEDGTARVAQSYRACVISLKNKPDGWMGKNWACQNGANAATGDLLLFLDADVRLGRDGLRKLMQAHADSGCTISVQPYHQTEKAYEQCSMLFNLVQIAANGTALPRPHNVGLCGPVILIARSDYTRIGGHESVKKCVVEDMALGYLLKQAKIPYRLFVGNPDVAFRMYGDCLKSLLQGWVKNIAVGAAKTPASVFWMVFFWITSMTSVPIQIVKYAVHGNMLWLAAYSLFYVVWVFILVVLSRRIGRFRLWAQLLYPVLVSVLLGVFIVSLFKKQLGLKIKWKGRSFSSEET